MTVTGSRVGAKNCHFFPFCGVPFRVVRSLHCFDVCKVMRLSGTNSFHMLGGTVVARQIQGVMGQGHPGST